VTFGKRMKQILIFILRIILRIIPAMIINKYALIRWKMAGFSHNKCLIALTYANDKHLDGAGAQLQRIYGIYAISRLLRIPYVHSPITAIEHGAEFPDFLALCNNTFTIPSDIKLPDTHAVYEVDNINIMTLERIMKESAKRSTFTLVRITYPYRINDVNPESLQVIKNISPFPFEKSSVVHVAINVRMGDYLGEYSRRRLPNSYYISVAQKLRRIFEDLKLEYVFELISDGDLENPELNKFEEFDSIPHLKKSVHAHPLGQFKAMTSAHVLIMSRSSFSYLAGLLNTGGVVMYYRFWHSPLRDWVITDDSGFFCEKKFLKQLKNSFSFSQGKV
jgi:hypothetical protein